MKARDYRSFNNAISSDLLVYINNHPDAFDALLFKPDLASIETVAPGDDVVGNLETEERALEYLDPVMVKAITLPDDFLSGAVEAGAEPDGNMDQPIILLIGDSEIPRQSVVQYREYINDTDIRVVSLYIVRSEVIGESQGIGEKHYCLPFQAFEYEFIEPPENESPEDEATAITEKPTLSASEFAVHGTTDTHTKSQWQIRTENGDYDTPAYDTGACTDLTSHTVSSGNLIVATVYYWRVRYRGAAGDADGETEVWSDYSEETVFTTAEEF